MIVGISKNTTPKENVKSFLKDLCEKKEFEKIKRAAILGLCITRNDFAHRRHKKVENGESHIDGNLN